MIIPKTRDSSLLGFRLQWYESFEFYVIFQAELQKVFQTMGLGTFSSLSSYYQSRVIKYEKLMYQQSQESL